jgi:hypothetical protein
MRDEQDSRQVSSAAPLLAKAGASSAGDETRATDDDQASKERLLRK